MRSLIKYRPYGLGLFDDMDRVFRSFFDEDVLSSGSRLNVDVREEENSYILEAELPGLSEKDIDVKVENDLLHISTRKEEKKEEKSDGYLLKERRSSSYHRSFVLPKDVDREKIDANFANGLLTLSIPKVEAAKARQIEVKKA
jgi:HSP20 family molecular chaperone IbpA